MHARAGRERLFVWGLALMPILGMGGCVPSEPERSRPGERALWMEEIPERMTDEEERALRMIAPQMIFFKVGDLDREGDRVRWVSKREIPAGRPGARIVLAVGIAERFAQGIRPGEEASLAQGMAALLREALERARRSGLSCSGIHLDFLGSGFVDRFEHVLARLREQLPRPLTMSATIPIAWERERALRSLLQKLDFYLVRAVREERPANLAALRASVDVREIGPQIRRFESFAVPFYIEVRAQGACFLLDSKGDVVSSLREAHPLPLGRRLGFRIVESYPLGFADGRMRVRADFAGEYVVVLVAGRASRVGERGVRVGDRVACRVPTAWALRRQIETIEATPSLWARGYSLWRSGGVWDLPLGQIALLLRGGAMEPKLVLKGERRGSFLALRLENVGEQESAFAPRAVQLHLRLEGAQVGDVLLGDFTESVREPSSSPEGASDRLVLYADGMGVGDVLRARVRLLPRGRVRVFASYRVRDPDEFLVLSGREIPLLPMP